MEKITSFAKHLKISESHLNKQYCKAFGTSPKQSVIQKRMALAKQLLCENLLTVGQVCEQCGYTSIYTFSRAFKAITGLSPSDYRSANAKTYL